jgi:hypothetical protein
MTLEGSYNEPNYEMTGGGPEPESSVTVEAAPPDTGGGPAPDQGGGGGGDQGGGGQDINQIYQQYLGRDVDPSGAQTYAGWNPQDIIGAIQGSQEYANRGGSGLSGGSTDGGLNQIYQQYLGRNVDPSGAQTFAGWNPQDVIGAIQGSAEYANRANAGASPTGGTDINSLYQQYLGRNADPGGLATWTGQSPDAIIAGITGSQEYQNLHPGAPQITGPTGDPSTWEAVSGGKDPYNPDNEITYYKDPKTGNLYSSNDENAQIVAKGVALNDKYAQSLNLDAKSAQELYDLKNADSKQYYNQVAEKLGNQLYEEYRTNSNYDNTYKQLQSLKDVDPQAYYKTQLDFLGKQVGWQTGQNTGERAAPVLEQIKQLAPQAQAAGVSADQINSIVNTGFSTANVQNQQRIAQEAAYGGGGFNFGKDVMPGVTMIAMAAATAATGGAAAAAVGTGMGLTGAAATIAGSAVIGAGMGALSSAAYGGNIGQGAIRGAIGGAVGGAGAELSAASGLVGTETINSIAEATNLSAKQVSGIIANTAATTIAAAATGQVNGSNFAKIVGTALASSAISAYAGNVVKAIDPTMAQSAINAVSGVARVAATTALNGGNIQNALMTNIPAIIGGYAGSAYREANQPSQPTNPFGTENIGFTSGGVDKLLQTNFNPPTENVGFTTGAVNNVLQRDLTSTPGPLSSVPEANNGAFKLALETGNPDVIAAVKEGNTDVINALNRGDESLAVAVTKEPAGNLPEVPDGRMMQADVKSGEPISYVAGQTYSLNNAPDRTMKMNEDGSVTFSSPDGDQTLTGDQANKAVTEFAKYNQSNPVFNERPTSGAGLDTVGDNKSAIQQQLLREGMMNIPTTMEELKNWKLENVPGAEGVNALGNMEQAQALPKLLAQAAEYIAPKALEAAKAGADLMRSTLAANDKAYNVIRSLAQVAANDASFLAAPKTVTALELLGLGGVVSGVTALGAGASLWSTEFLRGNDVALDKLGNWVGPDDVSFASEIIKAAQSGQPLPTRTPAPGEPANDPDHQQPRPSPSIPSPARPSPARPANDPLAPEVTPSTPGRPLTPILPGPYEEPGQLPEPFITPSPMQEPGPGINPLQEPAPYSPGEEAAPLREPRPEEKIIPVPQPQPQLEPVPQLKPEPVPEPMPVPRVVPVPTPVPAPTPAPAPVPKETTPTPTEEPVNPVDITTVIDFINSGGSPNNPKGLNPKQQALLKKLMKRPTSTNDLESMIQDLAPGLTKAGAYTLGGIPSNSTTMNPTNPIPKFATGGFSSTAGSEAFSGEMPKISGSLTPGLSKANINYILTGLPGNLVGHAEGGAIEGHNPEFYSEGGLSSMENRYVEGEGDGTSDSVPAMLANGEFVIPADVVASLGNGSNEAGASVLDQFLASIREHKHSKGKKGLPPESKGPLAYLTDAKRKVKA